MEFFKTIYETLTTPNEWMTNIICSPLVFVEMYISMLLFTTILNIKTTKKQKIIYILVTSIICLVNRFLIPNPYGTIINLFVSPLLVFFLFKASVLKSITAQIIPFVISVVVETLVSKFYLLLFGTSFYDAVYTPIFRLIIMLFIYTVMFLIYLLCKKFSLNIASIDVLDKRSKTLLIINSILGIFSIGMQYYLIGFYSDNLPLFITLFSTLTLLIYFVISLYSITRTTKLELTKQDLEETKLYNKTLTILHDNIRCFKHDFNNIIQAIGGYIQTNDMEGLNKYYKQILEDCHKVNNLATLSPNVINNPAIYSILASKYYLADSKGITINFEIFLDLNTLRMKIYEFTRILGILLDNAIEASSECDEKIINIVIRNDENYKRQILYIENTYNNKDIDTEKIYEKAFTTKPNNTGLGLWEVRRILNRNNNLNLFTNKNDKFFSQQLEMY